MVSLRSIQTELRPMTALAIPVVCAELGWMAMTVVDTMMVGRLRAEAIGAVSYGALLVNVFIFFSLGDRKSVVSGNGVSGRVDIGGRRCLKKKKIKQPH